MALGLTMLFLLPLSIGLLLLWGISGKSFFGLVLGTIWAGLLGLGILFTIIGWFLADKGLAKEDYYGQYIINRSYFPGRQADWQYENYRFEIKENDSIYFYVTQKEKVVQTFKGTITTVKPGPSERLVLHLAQPTHHILTSDPTTYRSAHGFYLVFASPKYGNVFFKQGEWQPLKR
jgi:hypothetical protein